MATSVTRMACSGFAIKHQPAAALAKQWVLLNRQLLPWPLSA
jgi:hypothetical protein